MSFGNPNITQAAGTSIGSTPQGAPPLPPTEARLGPAGYPLVNGTNLTVLQATAPNDGQQHPFSISATSIVTANETGGQMVVKFTVGGNVTTIQISAPGLATGQYTASYSGMCDPNTTVTIQQTSALTAGAATLYGDITIR